MRSFNSRTIRLPSRTVFYTTCRCKRAGSQPVRSGAAVNAASTWNMHGEGGEGEKGRTSELRLMPRTCKTTHLTAHRSRHQLNSMYLEASPQDISAKYFLNAAGFFRGCAVAVVSCEQSCGNHFLFFCPSGLSALHAPSVATSKASTLST